MSINLTISSSVWIQHNDSDRRTDGQTDTGRQQRLRLRIASRGKKKWFKFFVVNNSFCLSAMRLILIPVPYTKLMYKHGRGNRDM